VNHGWIDVHDAFIATNKIWTKKAYHENKSEEEHEKEKVGAEHDILNHVPLDWSPYM
jgi:hypothetical protein